MGDSIRKALAGGLMAWAGVCIGVEFMDAPAKFRAPALQEQRWVAMQVGSVLFRHFQRAERIFAVLATSGMAATVMTSSASSLSAARQSVSLACFGTAMATVVLNHVAVAPHLFRIMEYGIDRRIIKKSDVPQDMRKRSATIHAVYAALELVKTCCLVGCAATLV